MKIKLYETANITYPNGEETQRIVSFEFKTITELNKHLNPDACYVQEHGYKKISQKTAMHLIKFHPEEYDVLTSGSNIKSQTYYAKIHKETNVYLLDEESFKTIPVYKKYLKY